MFTRHNINNEWIKMMMVLAFAGVAMAALGGNLDAPAAPTNSASTMWTMNDIYNVLDTRTTNVTKRAGAAAFAEPAGLPTNGTMYNLNEIMTLVTNRAPAQKTGQTNSYLVGDDGTNQIGVAWPNPRFITNNIAAAGTNVVTDKLTGLMWTRNANLPGTTKDWTNAISYCTNMNYGAGTYGYTDWRLPNARELHSLIDYGRASPALPSGHPFTDVQSANYWSSSAWKAGQGYAWGVSFIGGSMAYADKCTNPYYVWPVRGGGQ